MLGSIERFPDAESIHEFKKNNPQIQFAITEGYQSVQGLAKKYLDAGKILEAWKVLLS